MVLQKGRLGHHHWDESLDSYVIKHQNDSVTDLKIYEFFGHFKKNHKKFFLFQHLMEVAC